MNKLKVLGIASALALALPFVASAATFSNVQFDNGDVTVSGTGGSTVNATFHVIVPANQVVENIETDVIGDNLAPICTSVGGTLGLEEGTHDVTVSVKLPPNTGTYTLNVRGAGIFGGIRSIDCNDNVVGTASFGGALRTVASGNSSTTGSGSSNTTPDWVAALMAQIAALLHPATPTPTVDAKCAELTAHMNGAMYGVKNQGNVVLQGYLLGEGESIPALAAGAAFGLWLNQTQAALMHFKSTHNCN